jgi:hypothetical protein
MRWRQNHAPVVPQHSLRDIRGRFFPGVLTRISHRLSTAAADPGMSAALRPVGRLDVLSSTPAAPSRRAPCIHARLRRLATKSGEKSGLIAPSRNVSLTFGMHFQYSICFVLAGQLHS